MYRNPTNSFCNDIKDTSFSNVHGYNNMPSISKTYNEDFSGINLCNGNYTTTFTSNQETSKCSNLRIKAIPQTDTKIVPHPLLSEKTDTKSLKKSEIRSIFNMNFRNDDFTAKFSKYSTVKMGVQVTDIIKKVITNIEDPNLTIKIGDVNFSCHWEVLLTFANYFDSAIIKKKVIEIPESHITAIGFDMSYQWMICDQPMLERNYIIDLFQAADFLQIESLMQHCWISIDNGLCFTEDRAFALYLESRKTNLRQLRVPMLHRISKYFLPIVATYDFLELNYDEVCTLLSSNLLAVNSELEIFFAAIKWLLHNWEERKKFLENVINCVRFMFISPLFLVGINNTNPMMFLRSIGENQKLCNSIVDGIQYSTIHTIHGCNPVKCAQLLEQCQLSSPKARKWLHDYECEYHHDFFCQRKGFMSYELFSKYLEKIALKGKDYWLTVGMPNTDIKGLKQCCIQAKIN